MKMKNYINGFAGILLAILAVSCGKEEGAYHSLREKIVAETLPKADMAFTNVDSAYFEVREGGKHFLIPNREGAITSFPCSSCHTLPPDKMHSSSKDGKRAHIDIEIVHADKSVMGCFTCHSDKDMDHLRSLTGESIAYNKSYLLCGQCHQVQKKDWEGGAHGKRMDGWQQPRKSLTCVNCHNPHKPAIQRRLPSRYNTMKPGERGKNVLEPNKK